MVDPHQVNVPTPTLFSVPLPEMVPVRLTELLLVSITAVPLLTRIPLAICWLALSDRSVVPLFMLMEPLPATLPLTRTVPAFKLMLPVLVIWFVALDRVAVPPEKFSVPELEIAPESKMLALVPTFTVPELLK